MEYIYHNVNPYKKHVRDCVYRAIAYFFGWRWSEAVIRVVRHATLSGSVNFNYTTNIVDFMENQDYKRYKVPRKGMTVREFGDQANPNEVYLVYVVKPKHLTIIDSCNLIDIWDCRDCVMGWYFKKEKEESV